MVDDPRFFKRSGEFIGVPYAEETEKPGRWKVIFALPGTREFYTETYTHTHVHPTRISARQKELIRTKLLQETT